MATLAEDSALQANREWLRKSAVADERAFDPARTPVHTHDDLVAELHGATGGLAVAAAALDHEDQ